MSFGLSRKLGTVVPARIAALKRAANRMPNAIAEKNIGQYITAGHSDQLHRGASARYSPKTCTTSFGIKNFLTGYPWLRTRDAAKKYAAFASPPKIMHKNSNSHMRDSPA